MKTYSILDNKMKYTIEGDLKKQTANTSGELTILEITWGTFHWRWSVDGRCGSVCTTCEKNLYSKKNEASYHYHVKEGCYCQEKCLPEEYDKFKKKKFKCATGEPPCSLGENEDRCHRFHCTNHCSEFRGENESCHHKCAYCGNYLINESNTISNPTLEEKGITLIHNTVHYDCWLKINQLDDAKRQLSLEEFF